MTAITPVPDSAVAPDARRQRRFGTFALAFVAGLAAVLVIAGAGLAAWDAGYEARILPGVNVGGVDLSGMDRAAAVRTLDEAFAFSQGTLVLRTSEGDLAIPYSAFGRRADVDALVDAAMRAGRDGSVLGRAVGEVRQAVQTTRLEPLVAVDQPSLSGAITAALATVVRPPINASVTKSAVGFETWPARPGRAVDPAPVMAAALAAVMRPDAPAETIVPVEVAVVEPVFGDMSAEAAKRRAELVARDVVVAYGKQSWTIKAATVRSWVALETTADGYIRVGAHLPAIAAALGDVSKAVVRKPVSASFLVGKSGRIIGAVAARDGRRLDLDATVASIAAELEARGGGSVVAPVKAVAAATPPDVSTEEAAKTAPLMTKLGSWTTWFPISERNFFGANIWRPAQIIDHTVLAPGRTFEWWGAIMPVSSARGFGPGGIIRTDHTDPTGALGGGMCSSSTTLFNAALRAGLRMGARSNHRYYINRYPLGLDATVSITRGRSQTMTFTNDTSHPIVILGIRIRGTGGRGFVRYEVWGIPDGRTVTISRPMVTNVRLATTNIVYVTTLPHGVRKQTEFPANGMDVSVTRTVRDAAGRIIHLEVYRSHYQLWNGRIEVGL